jgi:Zn-dependent protease
MTFKKFYRIFRVKGVPVYFHWSAVLMFGAFVLAIPFLGIPILFIAIGLFSIMIFHELGHAVLVNRLGYKVERIRIFPIHGLCLYEEPYSPYEDSIIAWGGVLAQLVLFVPATAILAFLENTAFGSINVLLVAFSYVNACIMAINLTPAHGLDGRKAWKLPLIIARAKWTMFQLKRKKILK